ncbi:MULTISPECIES: class I SAM-dependent methyltransferase [Rhodococcus]|uniref:Putative methyltransferase n=2 Tax=Rhodococcus opacus TaxID=37919 RepID=C1BD56_RHOOB|nr:MULTISPECIES: methyltransferase domain-containing protein [Rhodococcus]EID81283.1 putative methyltransferase [Rhodococcus opacus RKJ300 = JCM 13270]KAF0957084.1 Ubiquinone/menaquinone biosynthesis C-methyltransferase UbiE [Rhodococcus sp. T7]KAF0959830.1 Ubiquinone/menaquinone biosynthesis C-methyltransferase UbiE [Rhodococcus sp. T7]QQZ19277.1 methyltransferase domain-containing protein [Rhodococcus sp. 21391]UOT08051.1 methyltransferase domain-containing protein [Rhodococcus opacus]
MGLGARLLGDHRGHADDASGGLIRRARLYELVSAAAFLGRRRRVFDRLVSLSGAGPGDRVLDVGCGTGYFATRLAAAIEPGGRAQGIDPSSPMIDYATGRRGTAHTTFSVAAAERLPFPDNSFDVVTSTLVIHHIAPNARAAAAREMARVLRPGGRVLIADFRPPTNPVANHLIGALAGHAMQHTPIDDFAALLDRAGLHTTATGEQKPWLRYLQADKTR